MPSRRYSSDTCQIGLAVSTPLESKVRKLDAASKKPAEKLSSRQYNSNLGRIGLAVSKQPEDEDIQPFAVSEKPKGKLQYGIHDYRERVREFATNCPKAQPLVQYLDEEWLKPKRSIHQQSYNLVIADVSEIAERHQSLQELPVGTATRLIIAADLSPGIISLLGSAFNINPLVFVSALEAADLDEIVEIVKVNGTMMEQMLGTSMFSYECETEIETSLMCYSNGVPFGELRNRLNSKDVISEVDSALQGQDCESRNSKRPLASYSPMFCPPIKKDSAGTAELSRSMRALNRLTCLCVKGASAPIFILLTTPTNDWAEQGNLTQEYQSSDDPTPNWVNRLGNTIWKDKSARIVNVHLKDPGNPFFSKCYDSPSLASLWKPDERAASSTWSLQASMMDYYGSILSDEAMQCRNNAQLCLFTLNLRASTCALEAFEDVVHHAKQRLKRLKSNAALPGMLKDDSCIQVLREHRDMLVNSKERLDEHVQVFGRTINESLVELRTSLNASAHRNVKSKARAHRDNLERVQIYMRAVSNWNEQIIQDVLADLQRKLTHTQLDESRRSIEQNATMKKLTILAFVFVPISTVGTLFGMNIRGFDDVAPWIFGASIASVLVCVLIVTGYQTIRAIFSTLEALSFSYVNGPAPTPTLTYHRGFLQLGCQFLLRQVSRAYVIVFALLSLLMAPMNIALNQTRRCIYYGEQQQVTRTERRLDLTRGDVRHMIRLSIRHWYASMRARSWLYRAFWRLAFLPAFIFAFAAYHLDPSDDFYERRNR
ncbi:MAG: hypothetical protein MMC23_004823 [Stictis urceolatum]|nr:hypothetical protein [Stictis urceolata]